MCPLGLATLGATISYAVNAVVIYYSQPYYSIILLMISNMSDSV